MIRNISALTPLAQTACNMFMAECKRQGLNVLITETYRSQERQNALYKQGRTKDGQVVTWTRKSRHTSRMAWDICKNVKGQEYSDKSFFKECGKIAKKLGITWGGTWATPDTPHFEITAKWVKPKEEIDMEELARLKSEVAALSKKIDRLSNPMIYNWVDKNMPEWARATIQKMVDKKILVGDGNGLNLTDEMLRTYVILDRSGVFG